MVAAKYQGTGSRTEKVMAVIVYAVLVSLCIVCIFPFLNVMAKSVSGEASVLAGQIKLIPVDFHMNAYKYVFSQGQFFKSLTNSAFVVIVGTAMALVIVCFTAYALSKRRFHGSSLVLKLYVFTLIFSGGLIPGYLVVRALGLYDSLWALIIPATINPFYMLILRSFIAGVPDSLEESAKIDGAGHFRTLLTIIIPIAKPALASLCLFYAVDMWNDFFRPLVYIQKRDLYTLQLYLRSILIDVNDVQSTLDPVAFANTAPQSIQNATIIVSILPILMLYPFLQRYFVTGITLGAVKG